MGDPIKFHSERAAAELALAMRATHSGAARAHIGLSKLHLERLTGLISPPAAANVNS